MSNGVVIVVTGLLVTLVGFLLVAVFAGPVLDNFATSGANAKLGSFSGGKAFNDMFPLFYYIFSLVLIIGGLGAAGIAGKRLASG